MPSNPSNNAGHVMYKDYRIWYRVVGDLSHMAPGAFPVLALHGAPISHESLEPLMELADGGRPVVFYDQLGCGNSDTPEDPLLWTMERYVDEVAVIRKALGLDRIHLLGHSWGGMVAMEYALTQPAGLASLIIASAPSSEPQSEVEIGRLLKELPPQAGDVPEGGRSVFNLTHICRINPSPDFLARSAAPEKLVRKPKNAAPLPGKDWDITARLGEIKVPTLITSGRYDMITPAVMQMVKDGIPGSEWVLFEESSHYAHAEERQRYLAVVNDFLARVEEAATSGARSPS